MAPSDQARSRSLVIALGLLGLPLWPRATHTGMTSVAEARVRMPASNQTTPFQDACFHLASRSLDTERHLSAQTMSMRSD